MKRAFPLAILVAALTVAWLPLLPPHAIAGQSALSDWTRAEAIHAAVAGGDLLPAWLPDLYDRHGSPLPSFYAPLAYLGIEILRLVCGSLGLAVKLAYVLFWIVGALGSARLGRALFGEGAGIASAAAFALSPYLLADIYVRNGIAEFAAFNLAPWVVAAVLASTAPEAKSASPAADRLAITAGIAGLAALVLTHNLTALLVVPALLVVALVEPGRWRGAGIVFAGLGATLFFWLPALVEKRYLWAEESLTAGFFDYARHFVAPANLLPFRTSLEFTVGPSAGAPFRWGELLWAGLLAAPFLARRLEPLARRRALLCAGLAAAALFMTTSLSAPAWKALPLVSFVQFPFRFFLLATAFAAPLVGLAASRTPERYRALAAAGVAALALLLARPQLSVRYLFLDRATLEPRPIAAAGLERAVSEPGLAEPEGFLTIDRIRGAHTSGAAGHEYLPRTVTVLPDAPGGETGAAAHSVSPGVEVLSSDWGYPEVRAEVQVSAPGELVLQQFQFPGWRVEVDGRERAATAEPGRGRIVVALVPGDRVVRARFGPTPLRRWALGASAAVWIAGLLAGIALLASPRFARRGKRTA